MVLGAKHKGSVHLIKEAFGCLLLWPVTSLALVCVCVCVKVLGFEQGQFMVQSAWHCWKGQECKTLFNLFFKFLSCFNLLRNLNPENELKRYFGARAVLGDQRLVQNVIVNAFKV